MPFKLRRSSRSRIVAGGCFTEVWVVVVGSSPVRLALIYWMSRAFSVASSEGPALKRCTHRHKPHWNRSPQEPGVSVGPGRTFSGPIAIPAANKNDPGLLARPPFPPVSSRHHRASTVTVTTSTATTSTHPSTHSHFCHNSHSSELAEDSGSCSSFTIANSRISPSQAQAQA